MKNVNTHPQERFLDFHGVKAETTISKALVYKLISQNRFPRPIKLGKKSVWPASEIQAWMRHEMAHPRLTGRPAKAQSSK